MNESLQYGDREVTLPKCAVTLNVLSTMFQLKPSTLHLKVTGFSGKELWPDIDGDQRLEQRNRKSRNARK